MPLAPLLAKAGAVRMRMRLQVVNRIAVKTREKAQESMAVPPEDFLKGGFTSILPRVWPGKELSRGFGRREQIRLRYPEWQRWPPKSFPLEGPGNEQVVVKGLVAVPNALQAL